MNTETFKNYQEKNEVLRKTYRFGSINEVVRLFLVWRNSAAISLF